MKEKPIPYIFNDKFSQEGIFDYWAGRLPGHAHVNQTYPDVVGMWRQFQVVSLFFQMENNMMLSRKGPWTRPWKAH